MNKTNPLQDIEINLNLYNLYTILLQYFEKLNKLKHPKINLVTEIMDELIILRQKEIDETLLKTEFNKLNGELQFAKNFGPSEFDIESDPAIVALEQFRQAVDSIFRNGILDTITSTMSAVGEAIASGGNIGDSFGNALLGSISAGRQSYSTSINVTAFSAICALIATTAAIRSPTKRALLLNKY
jgi:hypothetical protein